MDFGCCGLVVDQVSIKIASHHLNGGEVLVMLSGDETKKSISHMEGKIQKYLVNKNNCMHTSWTSFSST